MERAHAVLHEPGERMARKRILLAEDDPSILKMTKLRLEYEGFDVIVATDGSQAIEQAMANGGLDLILMDIRMPKLDGLQVCQHLKADPATANIPIIVFTASTGRWQSLADRCLELGVEDWLKKPFTSRELLGKIHRVLGETP